MNRIKETARTIADIWPSAAWMKYAALRLGTFIMSYAATVATIVVVTAALGFAISFGAIVAILPIAVFFAIRVSGALTQKQAPKE